jgi:hypothetical protein
MKKVPSVGKFHWSLQEYIRQPRAVALAAKRILTFENARQPMASTLPLK